MIALMMWKNWGLAAMLHGQAKHFLHLAKQTPAGSEQEGFVRASIVFSVMSFEAFFFREVIMGYIQRDGATLDPTKIKKVKDRLEGKDGRFTGIKNAVNTWPEWLTGKNLDAPACADFETLLAYRNALVHGDITKELPSPLWGNKLAQEVETAANAELALQTIAEMIKAVALHFGLNLPPWV
jgi:hypothetical protein